MNEYTRSANYSPAALLFEASTHEQLLGHASSAAAASVLSACVTSHNVNQ